MWHYCRLVLTVQQRMYLGFLLLRGQTQSLRRQLQEMGYVSVQCFEGLLFCLLFGIESLAALIIDSVMFSAH